MTSIKNFTAAIVMFVSCCYHYAFAYEMENYGLISYTSTFKDCCAFDFITAQTPLALKQDLAQLTTHQQRILALAGRILSGHLKIQYHDYRERWDLYCNIGTNYRVSLVTFEPFWSWDPNINIELLSITLEMLAEHQELIPYIEALLGEKLHMAIGYHSERAQDVWNWLYKNISVHVKS